MLAAAASLVLTGLALPAAHAAAATVTGRVSQRTWSVQPTPAIPNPVGGANAISCTSSTFCMAVGSPPYFTQPPTTVGTPLAETWNGSTWKRVAVPFFKGSAIGLLGVSCTSPTFCEAVGSITPPSSFTTGAIYTWNGTKWALQSTDDFFSQLDGISCTSPKACIAVGYKLIQPTQNTRFLLAYQWNGQFWTQLTIPGGDVQGNFYSVSCSSASACTLVGNSNRQEIERWNGTSLSVQQPAEPNARATLFGVSCPQNNGCIAVGGLGTATFIEAWNGTTWQTMKPPAAAAAMLGVSCTSMTSCIAVGQTGVQADGSQNAIAAGLTGTTWSVLQGAQPPGTAGSRLDAVSCVQATDCEAVGGDQGAITALSLAEDWTGTNWATQPMPDLQQNPQGEFLGVSCAGAATCTALGNFQGSSGSQVPLAEQGDGSTWALHGSPPATTEEATAPAVISCPATNMCMAAGSIQSVADSTIPWAALWNGTTWTNTRLPVQGGPGVLAQITGISCASATSCLAVGSAGPTLATGLAYLWNGSTWADVSPATTGLSGVSCTATTSCMAVGNTAMFWNGQKWAQTSSTGFAGMNAVSCTSASACTAVGGGGTGLQAERWNGTSWAAQKLVQAPHGAFGEMKAVSCASATACTAVGSYVTGTTSLAPIAEFWNGAGWVSEKLPATGSSELSGVSCTSPTTCTAVGDQGTGTAQLAPLAERTG